MKIIWHKPEPPKSKRPTGRPKPVECHWCKKPVEVSWGKLNDSKKRCLHIYCNHTCAGLARRDNKTKQQKVAEKAEYDRLYREKNQALLKVKKAEHFKKTYDPVKAAIDRKKRMPKHVEYCRQPKYRAWKRQYDQQYHAKKNYGDLWESHLLIQQIQSLYNDDEVRQENNLHNKSQKRKRQWHKHQNSQQVL